MESEPDKPQCAEQREPRAALDDGLAELIRRLGAAERRKLNREGKRNGQSRTD